jgi:hypothetical protein
MESEEISYKLLTSKIEHEGQEITPLFELAKVWAKEVFPTDIIETECRGHYINEGLFDCLIVRKEKGRALLFSYKENDGFYYNLLIKGGFDNNREVPRELQLRLVKKAKEFGMNLKIKEA